MRKKIQKKNGFILAAACLAAVSAQGASVPGEYVVKLKPGAVLPAGQFERISGDTYLVRSGPQLRGLLAAGVDLAEPNYVYRAAGSLDWSLENQGQDDCGGNAGVAGVDVRARQAWGISEGSPSVVVAVIDTGVDLEHPRLKDKLFVNRAEAGGRAGVDDDGNGFVDDVHGFDFVSNAGSAADDNGHGTFCAGGVAASRGNDAVAGLAPGATVLPVRFLDGNGAGTLAGAIKAIDYAVSMGAGVINASWGGSERSELLEDAIRRAGEKGVLFVAAAGNSGSDVAQYPQYPASYQLGNLLSVAAVNNAGRMPRFSSYGTGVHLAAPGANISGLAPGGGTQCLSGTSMAAPYVTAAAALMRTVRPELGVEELRSGILSSVTPLAGLAGKTSSGGMLNAHGALSGL